MTNRFSVMAGLSCTALMVAGVVLWGLAADAAEMLDLRDAVVVARTGGGVPVAEKTAAAVLVEETAKRTGLHWEITNKWPKDKPVIVLTVSGKKKQWGRRVPLPGAQPEGFRVTSALSKTGVPIVWISGADGRGVLYGVGHFLRHLEWEQGAARIEAGIDTTSAPAYPIRGHQLGYRAAANSYDAWNAKQYEQYIRELALFGLNAVENIPFQDERPSPLMPIPRDEMNLRMSEICARYDLDYWVWTPADVDLADAGKREQELARHEQFYVACPRLDAVFFPGGDPGDNPPELVLPFLEQLSVRLAKHHPRARIWLSLQGLDEPQCRYVLQYLREKPRDWFAGIVAGPSSPPIPLTRKELPKQYGLRHYPDITHTVRCQYPTAHWDQAFALTLGRECANPQPVYYALIHNFYAPYTDGFLTYSDGVHDDVNKTVWSRRGWDPDADVRGILVEYARFFFGPKSAEAAADGILALEKNWEGPCATNGGIDATLRLWQDLEEAAPQLAQNWRWQLCLLRANYDAYVRHRLLNEQALEREANATLAEAPSLGAGSAMDAALTVLARVDTNPCRPELRARIEALCDALFKSIGLQTSVKKYNASGTERGCILDFVDYPLNNRWWLEDEFKKIRDLPDEKERLARLEQIRTWENPGPGSFYDDIGNIAKSPRVVSGEGLNTDPEMFHNPDYTMWWWDNGLSRKRLSWQCTMDWPLAVRYEGLDPDADYIVRMTGYGEALTRIDGQRVEPTRYGKDIGEIKEFPVPKELLADGILELKWDRPSEAQLNWRQQSRLAEIWLLKQPRK